jgi:hypothetical protein
MGSQQRFHLHLGEEVGGLFCARTSEGLSSWPFPFMRGHVANIATALAAAPDQIRKSTNGILRTRFSGAPLLWRAAVRRILAQHAAARESASGDRACAASYYYCALIGLRVVAPMASARSAHL